MANKDTLKFFEESEQLWKNSELVKSRSNEDLSS